MAEITEVKFKDPSGELKLKNGMHVTPENLTVERYNALIALSPKYADFFVVKEQGQQPKEKAKPDPQTN